VAHESGGSMNNQIKIDCALTSLQELRTQIEEALVNDPQEFDPGSMAMRLGTMLGNLKAATWKIKAIEKQLQYTEEKES
jgi:hypothetical protein